MKIKSRNEILNDVLLKAKDHPNNWNAVFGKDNHSLSSDSYLYHPNVGLYLLKEYNKNPFVRKGVGGKIARHLDQDIEKNITNLSGEFGIIQGDIHKIALNLNRGVHPNKIIDGAIKGDDLGLKIPVRGKASNSNQIFSTMKETITSSRKKVDEAFEKMAKKDGLYQAYD
jgi:hypothetical protein